MKPGTKMPMLLCCVFVVFSALPVQHTDLSSGTIIVLEYFGQHGMAVAADSREERLGSLPYDKACKMTPLGDQMLFAGAGRQSGADKNHVRRTFGIDFARAAYTNLSRCQMTRIVVEELSRSGVN